MTREIRSQRFESLSNEIMRSFVSGSTASIVAGSVAKITYYSVPESSGINSLRYVELLDTIRSFSELKSNWDSYQANQISENAITVAIKVLSHLNRPGNLPIGIEVNVFPMRDGGIQFDFDSSNLTAELEIDVDGNMRFLTFDDEGNVVYEEKLKTYELMEVSSLLEESVYA